MAAVERRRARFGRSTLVSDGTKLSPTNDKIRAPLRDLQAMISSAAATVAEVSAVLGSLDIVCGEVDR